MIGKRELGILGIGFNLIASLFAFLVVSLELSPFLDVLFGIIMISVLITNLLFIYLFDRKLNYQSNYQTAIYRKHSIILVFAWISYAILILGNFIWSFYAPNGPMGSIPIWFVKLLVQGSFGLLFILGIVSFIPLIHWDQKIQQEEISGTYAIKKSKLRICFYLILIIDCVCAIIILFGSAFGEIELGFLGIFIAQFGFFYGMNTFIVICVLLRSRNLSPQSERWQKIGTNVLKVLGGILVIIMFLPLFSTPWIIQNADSVTTSAFGSDFGNIRPENESYFLQYQFRLSKMLLGAKSDQYIPIYDVLFYNGSTGGISVDENITLYCDVYLPPNNGVGLPGKNSTLIRIHGGAWVLGDKGYGNMPQMNEYFAAQGYVVFDIQYGLFEKSIGNLPLAPKNVIGNFSVDDMVRHIGIFTQFLVANAAVYGANLSSVFISGGSAGGHLTCAVGLAMKNPTYSNLFASDLVLKGIIPFYPANGLAQYIGVSGDDGLMDPATLVNSMSVPCLIFHGTQDGMVDPSIGQHLYDSYINAGNPRCALLWMPFGGHASDMGYTVNYNQVFMYYMERFMYQFQ